MVAGEKLHPLFAVRVEHLSPDERVALSYERARYLIRKYALTSSDILQCTPKFWSIQKDPAIPLDIACCTIVAAHVGLAVGTIAHHAQTRKDLQPLVEKLLNFDIVGVYLLSERGHGLDAFNIETTATMNEAGFLLNTPREEATKFMPATTPAFNIPKVAVVYARLIVDGEDRGIRGFLVPICNAKEMCRGITSTRLPPRTGTSPLDFSLTSFNNVQLPHSALLGTSLAAPSNPLQAWWDELWRIQIGTAAVAAPFIVSTKHIAYIGTRYSMHRKIIGKGPTPLPIITFRTQQWPMLQAIAVGLVLDNWYMHAVQQATERNLDPHVKHALLIIIKATAVRFFQVCSKDVAERCGAQGTFEHNEMARIEADGRGAAIAEGDVLALCIKLFGELLLNRYAIPAPKNADTLLWRHAQGILSDNWRRLQNMPGGHRGDAANELLLPQAELAICAFGHALAYSAAIDARLPQPLVDIFECAVVRLHQMWYLEVEGMSSGLQRTRENSAIKAALPHLEEYLDMLDIEGYITAPIVTDQAWKEYFASLPVHRGSASSDHVAPPSTPQLGQPVGAQARL